MRTTCPKCEAATPAEASFCSGCGSPIRSAFSRDSGPISLGRVLTSAPDAPTHHIQVGIAAPVGQVESVVFAKPVAIAESVALAEPMAQVEAITLPDQPTDPFEDVHKPAVFEHIGVLHTDPGVPVAPAEPASLSQSIAAPEPVGQFEAAMDEVHDDEPYESAAQAPQSADTTADTDAPLPYNAAQLMVGSTPIMSLEELLSRPVEGGAVGAEHSSARGPIYGRPLQEDGPALGRPLPGEDGTSNGQPPLPPALSKLSPDIPATLGTNPRGVATLAVLAALFGLGFISLAIVVLEQRSAFVRFHAMQAFLLASFIWIANMLFAAMGVGESSFLTVLVVAPLLIIQAFKAYSGGVLHIPLLSDIAEALSNIGRE